MILLLILAGGVVFGLYMAWNIGANDVANAMGTSVGSRALTLAQALLVAAVFEFVGSVLVGGHVTETVKNGILKFERMPGTESFMVAMLAALLGAGLWLQIASWKGLPVSTTHSIVGGVAGAGAAVAGWQSVDWQLVVGIGVVWVLSPLFGGLLAFALFRFVARVVLQSRTPRVRVRRIAPGLAGIVFLVLCLSVIYKGLKNLHLNLPLRHALPLAAAAGLAGGLGCAWVVRRRSPALAANGPFGYVERQFRWLQVVTACYVAFAHGANDVANAVGPLAGIWASYRYGEVARQAAVPVWILALGGFGIVFGLATWGYRVIETIGRRITELTPSRGFSAEFAAATTVLLCSKLGIPISTTHTLVGCVIGVGLARGLAALDVRIVRDIVAAWIVTLPATFALAALVAALLRWALL